MTFSLRYMRYVLAAAFAAVLVPTASFATIVPFDEQFTTDSANWRDSSGAAPLGWSAAGGPDNSSYATGPLNFVSLPANSTPLFARAQDEFNSSGNAFVGNWINDGVNQFSVFVCHDAPQPLTFFTRFSGPANFPGVAAISFTPVSSGSWTQLTIPIAPDNPQFQFEGPTSTFSSVFGNVGHVQIGVLVPSGLAGLDQTYHFDLDQVQITPEPGSLAFVLAAGAWVLVRRGRMGATR